MRDQHRAKQDLINEVVALRKQVTDLREAMAARRRVEHALELSEEQLRALVDGSPVGLCLFRRDGSPVTANRPLARMLGYDSPAEFLSVGNVIGVFADPEELVQVLDLITKGEDYSGDVVFRRKNGGRQVWWAMAAPRGERDAIVLGVLGERRAASVGDTRSA